MKPTACSLVLVLVGACSLDAVVARNGPDADTGTTDTTPVPCGPDDCGSIPPLAPTPVCPDGSTAQLTTSCGRNEAGVCTWHFAPSCLGAGGAPDASSPSSCSADACGPIPPVVPSTCSDGSAATTTTTCAPAADGSCAWQVAQTCPDAGH